MALWSKRTHLHPLDIAYLSLIQCACNHKCQSLITCMVCNGVFTMVAIDIFGDGGGDDENVMSTVVMMAVMLSIVIVVGVGDNVCECWWW